MNKGQSRGRTDKYFKISYSIGAEISELPSSFGNNNESSIIIEVH